MTLTITYPSAGRAAWPDSGVGGTLDSTGKGPGSLYRAPVAGQSLPGLVAAKAVTGGASVSVNYYAVYAGVRAIQAIVGASTDGLFGDETGKKLVFWQDSHGLVDDGQYGPVTSKVMFSPFVTAAVNKATTSTGARDSLSKLSRGHIGYESGWDPGAVGATTPQDLGLGQINGPAHPAMTVDERLNPRIAIPYIVDLVLRNLTAMGGIEGDAIAAYNLGIGGATEWVRLGRPEVWKGKAVRHYITGVLAAA